MYNRSKNNFYNKEAQQKANLGKFTGQQQKNDNTNVNTNLYKKSDILSSKIIPSNNKQKILLNNNDNKNYNFEDNFNEKSKIKSNKISTNTNLNNLKEEKLILSNEVSRKEIELLKAELSLANSVKK